MINKQFTLVTFFLMAITFCLLVNLATPGEISSIEKQTAHVRDSKIDYEIYGDGIPIVMIHGFSVDNLTMKGCMEPIFQERKGWKRIYFDLPGMGNTKAVEWIKNSDDMLTFTLEFINKVIPNEKYLLVGESYGGYLAWGIIHKAPTNVEGLLQICPLVIADDLKRNVPKRTVLKKDTALFNSLSANEQRSIEIFTVVQNTKNWERLNAEMLSGIRKGNRTFLHDLRRIRNYEFSFDVYKSAAPFSKPALILTGRQDSLVGYKDIYNILDEYPRASFVVLDMAGHALQIEQEILFNALANELLDRIEKE